MLAGILGSILAGVTIFASLPSTSTYQLQSFGFGSGGTANSSTTTYALEGIAGETNGQPASTSNYQGLPGFIQTGQVNEPNVTLSNPSSYYNKLLFVLDTQNNPSDALYDLEVSTASDFSTNDYYVQTSDTLGSTLTLSDYQTYSSWGGSVGTTIIGLASSTTYYIRAQATQGTLNIGATTPESGYGPSSNATTIAPTLSFCVYTNANCAALGSSEAFGTLAAGSVEDSPTNIGADFATNANGGGNVYIYSLNGGLYSAHANYTIASATADLASGGVSEGFGAQVTSTTQSAGGPLTALSPYASSGNNVGGLSSTISNILTSAGPITGGSSAIQLQAKTSLTTPSASDYSETVTLIAAANF